MKKLLLIPLIATLFSCRSTHTNTLSTPMYAPKAEINPLRADVDVDMNKKLTGASQGSYFLCFQVSGDSKFAEGMEFSGGKKSKWQYKLNGRLTKSKYTSVHICSVSKYFKDKESADIKDPTLIIDAENKIWEYLNRVSPLELMKITGELYSL